MGNLPCRTPVRGNTRRFLAYAVCSQARLARVRRLTAASPCAVEDSIPRRQRQRGKGRQNNKPLPSSSPSSSGTSHVAHAP